MSDKTDSMGAVEPQPLPVAAEGDVWAEILHDLHPRDEVLRGVATERRKQGIAKYGTPLQRDNGRDHRLDALQEALDGWVYAVAAGEPEVASAFRWAAKRLLPKEAP